MTITGSGADSNPRIYFLRLWILILLGQVKDTALNRILALPLELITKNWEHLLHLGSCWHQAIEVLLALSQSLESVRHNLLVGTKLAWGCTIWTEEVCVDAIRYQIVAVDDFIAFGEDRRHAFTHTISKVLLRGLTCFLKVWLAILRTIESLLIVLLPLSQACRWLQLARFVKQARSEPHPEPCRERQVFY